MSVSSECVRRVSECGESECGFLLACLQSMAWIPNKFSFVWAILLTIDDADVLLSPGKVALAKVAMVVRTDLEILESMQEKFARHFFMVPLASIRVSCRRNQRASLSCTQTSGRRRLR